MNAPRADAPHLLPALGAVLAAVALLAGVHAYVRWRLPDLLPFYSAHAVPIKINGCLLPAAAFRAPDELSIYGSSELDYWAANRPDAFFRQRPTGFAVFIVGRGGGTCLSILQKIAAAGDAARGKKVVVVLSPSWFAVTGVAADALDANLGVPQMGEWIFGDALGPPLKADLARRTLEYPGKLTNQNLLDGALHCLARPSVPARVGSTLLAPVGRFQNVLSGSLESCAILWETVLPQRRWQREGERSQPPPPRVDGRIDWLRLAEEAKTIPPSPDARPPDVAREDLYDMPGAVPGAHDRAFVAIMANSREFGDLALLVRVLRELRMNALFISQPFNGPYWNARGFSAEARRAYYERLEAFLQEAGYPLRDFSEHEEDRTFFEDAQHPSARAWIFYDREIERFYSGGRD